MPNSSFSRLPHGACGATVLRPDAGLRPAARDRSLGQITALARRTGFFILPRGANGLRQPVHVQDLADAAVAVIDVEATHGRSYAIPGGETLAYAQMVERTLASLRPPARLIQVPGDLFKLALGVAHALGRLRGLGNAALARMGEDLVFDAEPARRDFGYAPRRFEPQASMSADQVCKTGLPAAPDFLVEPGLPAVLRVALYKDPRAGSDGLQYFHSILR